MLWRKCPFLSNLQLHLQADSLKNEFICIRFNQLPTDEITFCSTLAKRRTSLNISFLKKSKICITRHSVNINFLQLHQEETNWDKYLFHDDLWERLHILFLEGDYEAIRVWLKTVTSTKCNIDTKTCIKKYFNYVQHDVSWISNEFPNIAETILHSSKMICM